MTTTEFIDKLAGYVCKYAPEYGILVNSPIIAQGILESKKGTSDKVALGQNYFGLKWRNNRCAISNEYFEAPTAEQNANGTYTNIISRFCKFKNMEECVIGYFQWTNISNYANLKGITDPRKYLETIKADKYATSRKYVDNLMAVIDQYDLTRFDNSANKGEVNTMYKVFLSAGHGGSDPGAVANGLKEKNITLQILLACKDELERHGVKVICSRTKDENDPVRQEVIEANSSGADIAVSFHINAGGGDGFEAFYYANSDEGKKLAQLGEKYVKALGQNSRGLKSGNHLYFVKRTSMPAVLFESYFIDNANDVKIGDTLAEQKAFGVAYAKAILEYFGISYKVATASGSTASSATSTGKKKLYKVQVGAFSDRNNAEQMRTKLKKAGFSGIIVEV